MGKQIRRRHGGCGNIFSSTRRRLSPRLIFSLAFLVFYLVSSADASLSNRRSLPFSSRSLATDSSQRHLHLSSPAVSTQQKDQLAQRLLKYQEGGKAVTRFTTRRSTELYPTSEQHPKTKPCSISKVRPVNVATKTTVPNSPFYFIKVALAGGMAGAVGSAALYPMDAAKTLRQSNPSEYSSVFHALGSLISTSTKQTGAATTRTFHLQNVYRGVIPATLGAIPSSALYFGAYESMKTLLTRYFPLEDPTQPSYHPTGATGKKRENNFTNRLLVHALAAMSGNVLSSAVFVPKELIKQQLQYRQAGNVLGVMVDVVRENGIPGLYVGYKTTLLRNIPTAVIRFSLYEEFRYRWYTREKLNLNQKHPQKSKAANSKTGSHRILSETRMSPKFFLAGAVAGAIASGAMTPVDVLKTRLATGTCPVNVRSCFLLVVKEEGIKGLYSGAGARMVFSGAFSAIGFGTFEWAKAAMGVSSASNLPPSSKNEKLEAKEHK